MQYSYTENTAAQLHSVVDELARRLRVSRSCIEDMIKWRVVTTIEWAWRGFLSTIRMTKDNRAVVVFDDGLVLEEGGRTAKWFGPVYVADPRAGDCQKGDCWYWMWVG